MFDLELEEIGYDANVREGDDEGGGEDEGCILTQLVSDLYSSQILYDISKQELFF